MKAAEICRAKNTGTEIRTRIERSGRKRTGRTVKEGRGGCQNTSP